MRLRRWLAYRRALAALARQAQDGGYRISPPVWEMMRRQAREQAGYPPVERGEPRVWP